jgi:hypothetical protein
MSSSDSPAQRRGDLPIILIAAAVQGWSLYLLHLAVKGQNWPATAPAFLLALYAVAAFIPLTVQMLARFSRERLMWAIVSGMAVLCFYFGWHHGSNVVELEPQWRRVSDKWLPLGFVLAVFWLLVLPFVQSRLASGRWRPRYELLFATAWNNKLVLLEAFLFTGLFLLLLMLWQQLFFMLGIRFFRELFTEPVFMYPVLALTFGIALHLIGSLDRMTKILLEQLLSVFKWLALLAGVILALFTIALVAKLPGMIASGERVISAAWLLWLIAVTVLLVNAAYRDGTIERPYPHGVGTALRFVIPLTIVVSLTALYALCLRIDRFGFTVDRVWACVVAAAACVYSIGYALAVRSRGVWMAGIARVNVAAALLLLGILGLALTPVLSPYRIAASSQFRKVVREWPRADAATNAFENPLQYLRHSAGEYGLRRLRELAKIEGIANAATIRADAADVLEHNWLARKGLVPSDIDRVLRTMLVRPAARELEPDLVEALKGEIAAPERRWMYSAANETFIGAFVDMNGDGTEEFVLIAGHTGTIFEHRAGWQRVAQLNTNSPPGSNALQEFVERDEIQASDPAWKELRIGSYIYRPQN